MITKIQAFPKIFHLGEQYIENIFKDDVEITEKVDGSQWVFGCIDGEIMMRSKGQDLTNQEVPKMFSKAKEQVDRVENLLKEEYNDVVFYTEFLATPAHNILKYDRVPKNNLYLFGVLDGNKYVSDPKKLFVYANSLEIELPHIIYQGKINEIKELEKLLDTESKLGNTKVEGIVVKNYKEPAMVGSRIIPISMGKYVGEDFKERHAKEWKGKFTTGGKLQDFINSFRTEARWNKAVQHLKENNELTNSPKDIGNLMKELHRDLADEEEKNIKDELYKLYINDIKRKVCAGFPEWYKEQLLKKSIK